MEELLLSMLPQLIGGATGGKGKDLSGLLGGALGVAQTLGSIGAQRNANKNRPPLEDAEQRSFLNELNQKRKAIRTGSAYSQDLRQLQDQQASTNAGIVSAGGGAGGATLAALNRAQRGTQGAYGDILANAEKTGLAYDSMYENMLDKVSGRKMDMQNYEYTRALGNAAKNMKAGQENLLASAARTVPIGGGGNMAGIQALLKKLYGGAQPGSVPQGTEAYPDIPMSNPTDELTGIGATA